MSEQLLGGLDEDYAWHPVFQAFPKIPRYRRNYIITEKIDGTNAAVIVGPRGEVAAQSRKRLITPTDDNFGFATWVESNSEALAVGLGEGVHFGEWWGGKIQRGYGIQEKRFSLFNTGRWHVLNNPPPECCHIVPVLAEGSGSLDANIEEALADLARGGSWAAAGFMQPEGIVVYHTASGGYFKVLLEGDDIPKGAQG